MLVCPPGVGDADHMIDIGEYHFEKLVGNNWAAVSEAKQGMVSEHRLDSHSSSMEDTLMTQGAECLSKGAKKKSKQ